MNDKPRQLEIWLPIKPAFITQAWGIWNPAYQRFGFNKHNGVDIALPKDGKLCAPIRLQIYEQMHHPSGGGYQVNAISTERWIVPHLDDRPCYIVFAFAHNEKFLHEVRDVLEVGDEVAIPDNTGFSTGPHTHIGAYRVVDEEYVDQNDANGSFDWLKYSNGFYAEDKTFVLNIYKKMIQLLQTFFKGRQSS